MKLVCEDAQGRIVALVPNEGPVPRGVTRIINVEEMDSADELCNLTDRCRDELGGDYACVFRRDGSHSILMFPKTFDRVCRAARDCFTSAGLVVHVNADYTRIKTSDGLLWDREELTDRWTAGCWLLLMGAPHLLHNRH